MLRKRKKPTSKNVNTNSKTPGSLPVTYITETTTITADMICEDDVRIAGTLYGKLESKKKVIITESGSVKGSISSPEADISGKVDGDIHAKKSLTLRSSAEVDGEISTEKIKIEEGAKVKGNFLVGSQQHSDQKEKKVSDGLKSASLKAS